MCRCEPFSSYPRTYDLLHASNLFTHYRNQGDGCLLEDIMLEMDRLIRPQVTFYFWSLFNLPLIIVTNEMIQHFGTLITQGYVIIRDDNSILSRIRDLGPKFLWEVTSHVVENQQGVSEPILICQKKFWAIV